MRKVRLNLDEIQVETFSTGGRTGQRGTVHGRNCTCCCNNLCCCCTCCCAGVTCEASCAGDTCEETCPLPNTCWQREC